MRSLSLAVIALGLVGCAALPPSASSSRAPRLLSGQAIPGETIVRLKAGTSPATYARKHHLSLVRTIGLDMHVFRGSDRMEALTADPLTLWAEPNRAIALPIPDAQAAPPLSLRTTNAGDPLWPAQYAPVITGADRVWPVQQGKPDVVVAVIDSGIDGTHPEFQGQLLPGYDFTDSEPHPGGDHDGYGHGTHVAGIIGARSGNGMGIAGIAPGCKLMPVRIFDDQGHTSDGASNAAVLWAVDHGAKIINASWGTPSYSESSKAVYQYAQDHDVVVVSAVGNTGKEWDPSYPAAYEGVVAVSATNDQDGWASFSTWGDWITIGAPGDGILSTYPLAKSNGYRIMSGTSMAAPSVSAIAALARSQHPELTQRQVITRLYETAKDTVMTGKDKYVGYGRIDAARAVLDPL